MVATASVTVIQPTILENDTRVRVAAYCRVSSDSADQLHSYMSQIRYYENFLADSETETLIGVYSDEGITGTRMDKRDEFQRLMKDCKRGKIDRIYAKSISRFSRNTRDCLTSIRELRELGITIFFEKENIDTAKISDEMMVTIMGALAQEESTSISKNMKWSYRKRMRAGEFITITPPFGYGIENQNLYIKEDEATVVRKIFQMYLSGLGFESIINNLNSDMTFSLKKWSISSVRYLLINEKYMGDSLMQKYYTPEYFGGKHQPNKGEIEQYYIKNTHQGIISKDDFKRVQTLLKSRSSSNLATKSIYILSKKIFCENCGSTFRRKISRDKIYWMCRVHDKSADNCTIKQIQESQFYEAFIRLYNKLKLNYETVLNPLLHQLQEIKNKKFSGNNQFAEISKEIAQLKEQNHVLTRLKTKEFLDDAKYLEQTNEINAKQNKLAKELQKITRLDDEDDAIFQIQEIANFIENGADLMTEFDEVMFESLVVKIVVVSQNEVEFFLYGGLKFRENFQK